VAHGHKGRLYEKYLAGLEEQLGALGLVANCIVVWNTRYMQPTLHWLETMGEDTLEADVSRLSLLKHKYINMLGRYHFELDDLARDGDLRPLRDPESLDTFELTWEDRIVCWLPNVFFCSTAVCTPSRVESSSGTESSAISSSLLDIQDRFEVGVRCRARISSSISFSVGGGGAAKSYRHSRAS